MGSVSASVTIGDTKFAPTRFTTRSGSYGSVGTAEIVTSRKELAAAGLDLAGQAISNNGFLQCTISVSVDDDWSLIFGGEYVHATWTFDSDVVEIFARDWAGVLVDEKRVLTTLTEGIVSVLAPGEQPDSAGISNQNQAVAGIVAQVAKQFGFQTVIAGLPSVTPNPNSDPDTLVGSLFGDATDSTNYVPLPQPLWNILNRLARDTGNEIYITPAKQLVFSAPGAGRPTINLSWGLGSPPAGVLPVRSLSIQHNPRRNMSFRVLVISYDPARAQTTTGSAYVIGTKMKGADGQTIKPGLWPGSAGQFTILLNGQHIQLYSFHIDGLTQPQAQQRAMAIADDIAKREFILMGRIDGFGDITPLQTITIQGNIDQTFAARQFFVHGFSHEYDLDADGFNTTISALDIQAFGLGELLGE